jgi:putative ABC transport system permease protein
VLDAVTRVPGVEGATVDACAPLGTSCANTVLYIAGRPVPPAGQAPAVLRHYIAPDHFRVLGVPMLRGRAFTAEDRAGAPKVVIINETAARRFWPNEDPIGKRVWFGGGAPPFAGPDSSATIVGVVGDVPYQPLSDHGQQSDFFTPYQQFTYAWRMVIVRSRLPVATLLPAMRAAVRSAEPGLPLHEVRTMEQRIGESWARHRLNAALLGAFSILAIVLAATGIYSVVAHSTAQRTRELGIRIALGASRWQIVRLVIGEGIALPFVGLAAGTVAAFATTRVLRALLYGVSPNDSAVFSGVTLLLALVAIAATAIPARRATRVDPMEVLRAE